MNESTAVYRTSRVISASPSSIYAAFANPQDLSRWWGPNGFRNTFETFEFRPDGRWIFVMHGPDGSQYPNENVFRELVEGSKVVIQHVSQPHFTLTVTLEAHAEGTHLEWIQAFDDAGVAERIRHIVVPANEQNLDRLQAVLDSKPVP